MVFALKGTVTLTFDLVTSKCIGVINWPWPIFLPITMTVSHTLFKILSGHDVANGRTDRRTDGRTDGRTDERHTIIRPKFHFGRIKMLCLYLDTLIFGQKLCSRLSILHVYEYALQKKLQNCMRVMVFEPKKQQEGPKGPRSLTWGKGQGSRWSHLQRTTNVVHQILVEDL